MWEKEHVKYIKKNHAKEVGKTFFTVEDAHRENMSVKLRVQSGDADEMCYCKYIRNGN